MLPLSVSSGFLELTAPLRNNERPSAPAGYIYNSVVHRSLRNIALKISKYLMTCRRLGAIL
jgi:hypothetical protein